MHENLYESERLRPMQNYDIKSKILTQMPTISIIIRCYNEQKHIGRLLTGIVQQTAADTEIIVVDSGSTDTTLKIAKKFPVRVISIPEVKYTPGYSLNIGFKEADREIIVALSAHATPANSHWLSNLIAPLDNLMVAATSSMQKPHPNHKLEPYLYFWQWIYRQNIRTKTVQRYLFSNASSAY